MDKELLIEVAETINKNCYWIRVVDVCSYYDTSGMYSSSSGHVREKCMTLEVVHTRGRNCRGRRWHIPIARLKEVLIGMKARDATLEGRCRSNKLSLRDVDIMIRRATYGSVRLGMAESGETTLTLNLTNNE